MPDMEASIRPDCLLPFRIVTLRKSEQRGSLSEKIAVFPPNLKLSRFQQKEMNTLRNACQDFSPELEKPQPRVGHWPTERAESRNCGGHSLIPAEDGVSSRRTCHGVAENQGP